MVMVPEQLKTPWMQTRKKRDLENHFKKIKKKKIRKLQRKEAKPIRANVSEFNQFNLGWIFTEPSQQAVFVTGDLPCPL